MPRDMWVAAVLTLVVSFGVTGLAAEEARWQRVELTGEIGVVAVAVDATNSNHLFAASQQTLYQTDDHGQNWTRQFRVPSNTLITQIVIDYLQPTTILLATSRGLYGSLDGGVHWTQSFQGLGVAERQCTAVVFHPARAETAVLGTHGGLFISHDRFRSWALVQSPLAAREIIAVTFDANDHDRLYVATTQGVFSGTLASGHWQQLFNDLPSTSENEELIVASLESETPESSSVARGVTAIAIDPLQPSTMYVAGAGGVSVSQDHGKTWRPLTHLGLPSPDVSRLLPYTHSPLVIYAATARGVARYEPWREGWVALTTGLPDVKVFDLAASPQELWAATEQGLYRYDISPPALGAGEPPTPQELLANFVHEPTIAQVRDAAIRYAEVHPDKIKRWRRQAALKALLPTVDVGWDRDRSIDKSIDEGSFPNFQLITTEDRDLSRDFSIQWDLGELIWNDDQTSIDVRSKLMVELRDDIVDEVTRTYFERRRLQVALLTNSPNDAQVILEKELRLQELTAQLDGLTGGDFSRQLHISPKP